MYEIHITSTALTQIRKEIKKNQNLALTIADKHVIGSTYDIVLYPKQELVEIGQYELIFPETYHNHGFSIYVDRQLIQGNFLPDRMILDYMKGNSGVYRYEIKNPDFEK
jgi:hypothetical protein